MTEIKAPEHYAHEFDAVLVENDPVSRFENQIHSSGKREQDKSSDERKVVGREDLPEKNNQIESHYGDIKGDHTVLRNVKCVGNKLLVEKEKVIEYQYHADQPGKKQKSPLNTIAPGSRRQDEGA
jgi:hypothetical protein